MPGAVGGWQLMAVRRPEPSERQPDSWERALAGSLEAWGGLCSVTNLPPANPRKSSPFFESQFPRCRNLEAGPRRHGGRTRGLLSQSP